MRFLILEKGVCAALITNCTACVPNPPVPAALIIKDSGIAVPPSVNRARVEADGTVVLEYVP